MRHYNVLDKVNTPEDLKNLSFKDISALCGEIREFLIENISKTGGHLASNLGCVELTVAMHLTFNSLYDRLIFDVGHQSYVHKILTSRKDKFDMLRKFDGISGFTNPFESDHDAFISGHASTSISVALGMARARTLQNQDYNVVALIGDGALTGGMAYEALNDAGQSNEPIIVILNDNDMSICRSVGALSKGLSKIRIKPQYFKAKYITRRFLSKFRAGKPIISILHNTKNFIKKFFIPDSLFKHMGFTYLGPTDGHNITALCDTLNYAKKLNCPVLVHVKTIKGKGYEFSEKNPVEFHGISEFDILSGELVSNYDNSFSKTFSNTIFEAAKDDQKICAITAAMGSGTGLSTFAKQYPKRYFDVGIAEEHAVTMAAAMAKQGMKPVCTIYSTFLQRAYDQIIHDISILNLAVLFAIDRAGIVGEDGETHNGVFDVAFLNSVPNMKVFAPSSYLELKYILNKSLENLSSPIAVRYPRGRQGLYEENNFSDPSCIIAEGADITIVTYGIMINEVLIAKEYLSKDNINVEIIKLNSIKPIEYDKIIKSVQKTKKLIVVEDCVLEGSVGQRILSELSIKNIAARSCLLNISDRFLPPGTIPELYEFCGIDHQSIYKSVVEAVRLEKQ